MTMIPYLANAFYERQLRDSGFYNNLRHIIEPSEEETSVRGVPDASGEAANTVLRGLQHKYRQTVLMLVADRCFSHCRFCFRNRLVGGTTNETVDDIEAVVRYIAAHNEISDIHLSGGDPFVLSTEQLNGFLNPLLGISHVRTIRFGTKSVVHDPARFADHGVALMFKRIQQAGKMPVVITHIDHFGEISEDSRRVVRILAAQGVQLLNQAVLLRQVNDRPEILAETFRQLHGLGIRPYYLFQGRPVCHGAHFQVPLLQGARIVGEVQRLLSGSEKTFRFILSHHAGKIEILGMADAKRLVMKYHQCRDPNQIGRIFSRRCRESDCWVEDMESA